METAKILIIYVVLRGSCGNKTLASRLVKTCGVDNSPIKVVYEGFGKIQTYPWLGTLYYPIRDKRFTTVVVLISKQVVISSAIDIDKLPKTDFRARSRVVLGDNCNGPAIGVREYNYHPTYNRTTYSALVLIQLEIDFALLSRDLRPICHPPTTWNNPQFFAITLSNDCSESKVTIHKMSQVSVQKCKSYYRNAGLDVPSMWPTDTVCARTVHGKRCVWKNGVVLMMRQNDVWSLIGFGVAGPGCRAPARFIDYSVAHLWASHSIARIGRPAITRIADNHLVMRRTSANLQRYGLCDSEEIKSEIFTDRTEIKLQPKIEMRRVKYNFTVLSQMEYSCIVFKVDSDHKDWDPEPKKPSIRLRRWCTNPKIVCYVFQYLEIDFYVEIFFSGDITYKIAAYGEEARMLDMKKALAYVNNKRPFPEIKQIGVKVKERDKTKSDNKNVEVEMFPYRPEDYHKFGPSYFPYKPGDHHKFGPSYFPTTPYYSDFD